MNEKEWNSLHLLCKLFFYSFILISCKNNKDNSPKGIFIIWKDSRAAGISISKSSLSGISDDSLKTNFQIRLANRGDQPFITGDIEFQKDLYIFKPLIPFTRGLSYEIIIRHQFLARLEIPRDTIVPELYSVYPDQDTLPENLLKIYFIFSRPMVQGHSLQYIKLTNESGDSLPNTFLKLPNELWNEAGTGLTLWLDPGRIKRGLIPNKQMGPPLIAGKHYKLIISGSWPDIEGTIMNRTYTKKFVTTIRDSVSPSPDKWKIIVPEQDSGHHLEVYFDEPLDYELLFHTLSVVDSNGKIVKGSFAIAEDQKSCYFNTDENWHNGSYKLLVESRLEDLAGNNLNRVFDRDMNGPVKSRPEKKVFEKEFLIK